MPPPKRHRELYSVQVIRAGEVTEPSSEAAQPHPESQTKFSLSPLTPTSKPPAVLPLTPTL